MLCIKDLTTIQDKVNSLNVPNEIGRFLARSHHPLLTLLTLLQMNGSYILSVLSS